MKLIKIRPVVEAVFHCPRCSRQLENRNEIAWQGVHVCADSYCEPCKQEYYCDLKVGQSQLLSYIICKSDSSISGSQPYEWLVDPLRRMVESPKGDSVCMTIEKISTCNSKAVIVNLLDSCYGHALLALLNLQTVIEENRDKSVIVITQPFLKWLIPVAGISEIWVVPLSFGQLKECYTDLNKRINEQLLRFNEVSICALPLCPKNVDVTQFSKVERYCFDVPPLKPRITFVWREDVTRLWVKSYWFYGLFRKMGVAKILKPLHYIRVLLFLCILRSKLRGYDFRITLAGLGKSYWFPSFVDDKRVLRFDNQAEIDSCKTYAESVLVIGVHGSSLILPSAHAGMALSIMPPKRWGNYIEDLIFTESDTRVAVFQKRVMPMKTSLLETADVCVNMVLGREVFVEKFLQAGIE